MRTCRLPIQLFVCSRRILRSWWHRKLTRFPRLILCRQFAPAEFGGAQDSGRKSKMKMRTRSEGILLFSGLLLGLAPLLRAEAQDVDVPGNLTMRDSTGPMVGNILKGGATFLHNFGTLNTFVGKNAGNFTTTFLGRNTGVGVSALQNNTTGSYNTAIGLGALQNNTVGFQNTASGV